MRNYEIFIKIKDDLSDIDRNYILDKIKEQMEKYHVKREGTHYFYPLQHGIADMRQCIGFYVALEKYKQYFELFSYNSYFEGAIQYREGEMNLTVKDKNVYVVSDIHNHAEYFKRLLQYINFSENDLLIINGDIFDRGYEPMEVYREIISHPNIQVIQGNHDVWVARKIIEVYGKEYIGPYLSYDSVDFLERQMTKEELLRLAKWIMKQPYYIKLNLDGKKYQIAHAQTFPTPERMWDKSKLYLGDEHHSYVIKGLEELDDCVSVIGHTPTNDRKIWISPSGKTIRTDCGVGFEHPDGRLGAIRLNDMKTFYVGEYDETEE